MKLFFLILMLISILQVAACKTKSNELKTISNQNQKMNLPETIEKFIKAVNDGDNENFLSFFDKDKGIINDWGRKFVGHEAIKGWSDKEFIGAKGKMTPTKLEKNGEEYRVFADWKSNFYSGASLFIFTLDGEKIKEMRIESAK